MTIDKILRQQVSYYQNAKDALSLLPITYELVFNMIRKGKAKDWNGEDRNLIPLTQTLRQLAKATDEDPYKEYKRTLPMFTGSGVFDKRGKEFISSYNNVLILDYDLTQPPEQEIIDLKNTLIRNARQLHLFAVWRSPGHGVKAAMLHDNTNPLLHSDLFEEVKATFYPPGGIKVDDSCKDVSRSCFISYDPDMWLTDDIEIEPYHFDQSNHTPSSKSQSSRSYGHFQHTAEEIEKNRIWQETVSDKTLLNKLHKTADRHNPNYYKDGYRHQEIIRRATLCCKDGVLYENALVSLKGKFGGNSRAGIDEKDIESMVNSCYNLCRAEFGIDREKFIGKNDRL